MADHPIFADDMKEIVDSFIVETHELFEELDNDLLQLEQHPDDTELVNTIFRAVHTVKGTSGFLSLEQLSFLTHHFEDVLNKLRRSEIDFHASMMDVMFVAFDQMKVLVQQVIDGALEVLDLDELVGQLKAISDGSFDTSGAASTARSATKKSAAKKPAARAATEEPAETVVEEVEEAADEAPVVDRPHPIFADDMKEIVDSFIVETHELFEELDNDLLQLEQHPDDTELVNTIFRAVHTVKGTSGFLSLEQLSFLTHHFEDVLNKLRRSEIDFHASMMDVMFVAFDQMKVLVQQVIDGALEVLDLDELVGQLKAISDGSFDTSGAASTARSATKKSATKKPAAKAAKKPAPAADKAARPKAATPKAESKDDALKVALKDIEAKKKEAVAKGGPAKGNDAKQAGASRKPTDTIRVEVERLDSLMDLVGELVLGRNRLLQLVSDMKSTDNTEELVRQLSETNAQVDFITTELQTAVMHTRMVQIGRVFNKFPRVVRDLAKEFGKQIDLKIEGEETELDKSLVEEISDPLVHLVRNAADHGIETPEVREAAGKPVKGQMRLAARHEGNNVVIEIEDDGAGINVERVKAKALERGLITEKEADEMSDAQAFQLLFRPGFSTAQKVSKVSGRGVGMDVVKTNISRLNGTINITSTQGQGSRFTLKLPLTLAIIQGLLVRVGEETFAVPLHSVIEVVGLSPEDISTIRGREVITLREQVLPLMRIGETLDVDGYNPDNARTFAVIIGIAHHRLGLVVDALTGQKEIVIKPLGNYLKKVSAIAGSTILGDGRVIMILDVAELVRLEQNKRRGISASAEAA